MESTDLFIYVQEGGFVIIGCPQKSVDSLLIPLTHCATIRKWENGKGLGGVATDGPVKVTLDPEPDHTTINLAYVLRIIPCSAKPWANWIRKGS